MSESSCQVHTWSTGTARNDVNARWQARHTRPPSRDGQYFARAR